jgi:hypothetical protein
LRKHKLYAKFNKCDFYQKRIQYLGHVISTEGIAVDPEKIRFIMEWPIPKDVVDILSFMGITGNYRKFIEGFSQIPPYHIITKERDQVQLVTEVSR